MFSLLVALRNIVIIILLSWIGVSASVDKQDDEQPAQQPESHFGVSLLR